MSFESSSYLGASSPTNNSTSNQSATQQVPLEEHATAPAPQHMFKPLKIKAVVEELLRTKLEGAKYETSETTKLSTELANLIRTKIKSTLREDIVLVSQVVFGEFEVALVTTILRRILLP